MIEPGEASPALPPDALVVRAHHAKLLWLAGARYYPTEVIAEQMAAAEGGFASGLPRDYSLDVAGDTAETTTSAQSGIRGFLDNFRSLDPDHHVAFAARKDGICASCAIGKHCETMDLASEEAWVIALSRTAGALGLQDQVGLTEEETTTSKGRGTTTTTLLTTADVARKLVAADDLPMQLPILHLPKGILLFYSTGYYQPKE